MIQTETNIWISAQALRCVPWAIGDPEYDEALKDQIDKLMHTSNLYYNVPAVEAAEKLVKASAA